jgi:hypothetical protein
MEIAKGKILTYYYVTCGRCGMEEPLGTTKRENVSSHLSRGGWKQTKRYGYVCYECSGKEEVKQNERIG